MKFCPNCGNLLENKKICLCGYNTETNEVDENKYNEFKSNERANYEMSVDVIPNLDNNSFFGMMTKEQYIENVHKMGVDSSTTDEQILEQVKKPIFNKDNDNLQSKELLEILKIEK